MLILTLIRKCISCISTTNINISRKVCATTKDIIRITDSLSMSTNINTNMNTHLTLERKFIIRAGISLRLAV